VLESRPGQQAMSIREPAGVAGLIIPWNSPAYLCVRALAPALAAGCTAVVKMPHQAAQIAALTSSIVSSVAEIPKGVVNIVIESGAQGAKLLVDSPRVPAISFTGSTATGRAIAQAAAVNLKRVGLELGGKTPHLIFEDAQLEAVLPVLEKSSTVFAGQFCMTGSRILVHRSLANAVREGLAARLSAVRAGPASNPSSDMGPLIDKASVSRVNAAVEAAIAAGAKPLVRGGPSQDAALEAGAFYLPTLLEVTDASLPIVRQETFGPVQTLQVFDTEEEAIALANDSEYGLSACIWTRDVDRPVRVARRLQAGLVSINSWANLAIEFEEGGFKASGSGRLGGLASLEDFLEYKQITQNFISHSH
jgi:betaine-aldehyde dehydrogenase